MTIQSGVRRVFAFFHQPLNQGALVALGGVLLGWASGQTNWQVAAITGAGAIVAWALPDNSVAKADVEAVVKDVIAATTDIAKTPK